MENSIFVNNLKHLMTKHNLSQRDISKVLNVSPATINNYLNKNLEPSLSFLCEIKNKYGYSIDQFVFENISNEQINLKQTVNTEKLEKFVGTYMFYCYNSSEYKGKISSYSKTTLKYAVISILDKPTENGLKVVANFIKDRDTAENFKSYLDGISTEERERCQAEYDQFYSGALETSSSQIFIYLKSTALNDQSLIILNNPPSNKEYIGGLGTANSVSRGREHMPCIQFAIISKKILQIPDGQIYNLLSLGVSEVNVEVEAEQLINLFKSLYLSSTGLKDDLNEYQKKTIFQNSLNNMLIDLIDANMFRFAKVSNMEDDDYYRIIKEE